MGLKIRAVVEYQQVVGEHACKQKYQEQEKLHQHEKNTSISGPQDHLKSPANTQ